MDQNTLTSPIKLIWFRPSCDNRLLGTVLTVLVNILLLSLVFEILFHFLEILGRIWPALTSNFLSDWSKLYDRDIYWQLFVGLILLVAIFAIIYYNSFSPSGTISIDESNNIEFEVDKKVVRTFKISDIKEHRVTWPRQPIRWEIIALSNWLIIREEKFYISGNKANFSLLKERMKRA